ncbi:MULTISPECIES: sulfite exporter TauE/SafE family protein [unclassified Enterococcus]|uniref:sulfite exporter TauE/SafE family protein n=1 Tax=unclassified Enterococcus TaxID=2608891 RepID=UPI001CE159A7|nr:MULTISPECIES: sulfite exporter TauE/SafE family protein [unclassified Enterococcus]MCA5014505.1 sulfite exporter TauE/SafE family protein [Enterococcus sp. S23]MCA5017381.1 sulfite exporter TauE/SafE family protein [Enterococcus sp. S22(2020)]
MKILLIYFVTVFLSNTVGALSGMGGGVIIKPALDFLGYHSLNTIAFYSSVAVFTMSISSTYKQYQNGIHIQWNKAVGVSMGSLIGGMIGDLLLNRALIATSNQEQVQMIQYSIMLITLILVLLYNQFSDWHFQFKRSSVFVFVGLFLGILSTFLGIGGGPINVACLIFFFGMEIKSATVYSIITIFFSQLAKLGTIAFSTGFAGFDLTMLWAIIPAALLGGYVGGVFSKKMSEQRVAQLYSFVIFLVILLNSYNLWMIVKGYL